MKCQGDLVDEAETLLGYLGESGKILNRVKETVEGLQDNFQLLFIEDTSNRFLVLKSLVSFLQEKGYSGLIVTLNIPYVSLKERLAASGISTESLAFVDGITKHTHGNLEPAENVLYLESLKDLVEISVSIDRGAELLEGKKTFLIFDSLTTLLVYNEPLAVEKFAHNLIGKMRSKSIASVFFIAAHANQTIIDSVAEFCDSSSRID